YFESQTDFFKWLSEKVDLESGKSIIISFGSCLLKNIAQIACNASVIEHWDVENYQYVPRNKTPVATGLYPAVSMMNHSCRANVSMYYIDDIVIVKAIGNIKRGQEICNCYGINYCYSKKGDRQSSLYAQYGFKCLCEICSNPRMELDYLNAFKCTLCFGSVPMDSKVCYDCQKTVDLSEVFKLEKQAKDSL
ncbi:SET domain-containing protein, partial [Oryctes borbonicus]